MELKTAHVSLLPDFRASLPAARRFQSARKALFTKQCMRLNVGCASRCVLAQFSQGACIKIRVHFLAQRGTPALNLECSQVKTP